MTIYAAPGGTLEASLTWPLSGLAGTIGVRIIDTPSGSTILARTTSGIVENPAGSGLYYFSGTAPTIAGSYSVIWDDGSVAPGHTATDDLIVTYSAPGVLPSGPYLCSLADVKLALQFESDSTQKDAEITALLPTATRILEAYAQRNFTSPTAGGTIKRLVFRGGFLSLPDLQAGAAYSITRVIDATLLVEETDYFLEPVGASDGIYTYASTNVTPVGPFLNQSLSAINRKSRRILVDVSGTWGFPAVPELAKRAAVAAIGAWVSKGVAAMRGSDDGQGAPPNPVAAWTLPYAAKDIISDLVIKSTA